MSFTDLGFYGLLIVLLVIWPIIRFQQGRIWLLLLFSWLVYATWSSVFLGLLLYVTAISFISIKLLERRQHKVILWVGIALTLLPLATYKWHLAGAGQGVEANAWGLFVLPVGLSFYTFQALSMVIDTYRQTAPVVKKASHYALFIAFFPQVLAGPILRGQEFWPQLAKPLKINARQVGQAVVFVLCGLFLKRVVGDQLGHLQNNVFLSPEIYHTSTVWLAIVASPWRFVGDFGGYAIMAIGFGKLFGINLPHNFGPFWLATNGTQFWRNWHQTLTLWMMDYIFRPLFKTLRRTPFAMLMTCLTTFILMGLWHGSSPLLLVWGAGLGMCMFVSLAGRRVNVRGPQWLWKSIGWLLIQMALIVFTAILILGHTTPLQNVVQALATPYASGLAWWPPMPILVLVSIPVYLALLFVKPQLVNPLHAHMQGWLKHLWCWVLVAALLIFSGPEVTPFLYFQY